MCGRGKEHRWGWGCVYHGGRVLVGEWRMLRICRREHTRKTILGIWPKCLRAVWGYKILTMSWVLGLGRNIMTNWRALTMVKLIGGPRDWALIHTLTMSSGYCVQGRTKLCTNTVDCGREGRLRWGGGKLGMGEPGWDGRTWENDWSTIGETRPCGGTEETTDRHAGDGASRGTSSEDCRWKVGGSWGWIGRGDTWVEGLREAGGRVSRSTNGADIVNLGSNVKALD